MPGEYHTIVTVLALVAAFYGVDYAYRKFLTSATPKPTKDTLNELVKELATNLNVSETKVRDVLDKRFTPSRAKQLMTNHRTIWALIFGALMALWIAVANAAPSRW